MSKPRVFVLHPMGVRRATFDGQLRTRKGEPESLVHIERSLRPVWVHRAQVYSTETEARSAWRRVRDWREDRGHGLTIVAAAIELSRAVQS